jgi:hypothetical protein
MSSVPVEAGLNIKNAVANKVFEFVKRNYIEGF